jgi:hypothetical protein
MSGTKPSGAPSTDDREQWAALDQKNERLVDASHPLLAELRRDYPDIDRSLPAAG